jgi:hypothetical protein
MRSEGALRKPRVSTRQHRYRAGCLIPIARMLEVAGDFHRQDGGGEAFPHFLSAQLSPKLIPLGAPSQKTGPDWIAGDSASPPG